jgi:hypothetical protein
MKTGTPPRIDGRSLNWALMEEQKGDENPEKFSYTDTPRLTKQRSCYVTYTNENVHEVLRKGFDKSPMFSGRIKGLGPRYCPSVEDKINRFADKDRHQIFVEPEGWNTVEMYINGCNTIQIIEGTTSRKIEPEHENFGAVVEILDNLTREGRIGFGKKRFTRRMRKYSLSPCSSLSFLRLFRTTTGP